MDNIAKGMPVQDPTDIGRERHAGRHLPKASVKDFPSFPVCNWSKVLGISRTADDGIGRKLAEQQAELVGLHAENPKKGTARPTTERLLAAFRQVTLTRIELPTGVVHHVPPLTPLQCRILELLDLSPDIYHSLAENSA